MTPSVAVAIVSWNTRALLDASLRALRADAEEGTAEVWVVDNGSGDGSPEMVAADHPWVRLERPAENLGFGRGVNHVAARSDAAWIVAANADTEVAPGALRALLAAGDADPRAGALAPRLVLPDGSTQPSVQPFPTLGDELVRAAQLPRLSARVARGRLLSWDPDRDQVVPWATGAFLLLRRSAFDAVGRFDERQWLYAEDMDLGWRLGRAGWRTRYVPGAQVRHWENASTAPAFGAGFEQQWMGATWAWMARTHGLPRTWAIAGLRWGEAAGRTAVLAGLARRTPARYADRRDRARAGMAVARFGLRSRRRLLEVR